SLEMTGFVHRGKHRIPFVSIATKKSFHPAVPPYSFYTTYRLGTAALSYNQEINLHHPHANLPPFLA
ncbi:MAG: hypothetical protein AB1410_00525, partial [Acidobacteriota bacterium]